MSAALAAAALAAPSLDPLHDLGTLPGNPPTADPFLGMRRTRHGGLSVRRTGSATDSVVSLGEDMDAPRRSRAEKEKDKSEKAKLEKEKEKLLARVQDAENKLRDAESRHAKQVSALEASIMTLKTHASEKESAIGSLQSKLENAQVASIEAEKATGTTLASLRKLAKEQGETIDSFVARVNELERKLGDAGKEAEYRADELEREIAVLEADARKASRVLRKATASNRSDSEEEDAESETEEPNIVQLSTTLSKSYASIKAKSAHLTSDLARSEAANRDLSTRLESRDSEIGRLQARVGELEARISCVEKEKEELKSRLSKVGDESKATIDKLESEVRGFPSQFSPSLTFDVQCPLKNRVPRSNPVSPL